MNSRLSDLVRLTRELGDPDRDYAIAAEGSTAARIDASSFWVLAAGSVLREATEKSFVEVRFDSLLERVQKPAADPDQESTALIEARHERDNRGIPCVESFLHAVCLSLEGVNFVGHCHPTAINRIACSKSFSTILAGRLFPDEVTLCRQAPALIPYVKPGLPLAREILHRVEVYREIHGANPTTFWLQNYGSVAVGRTEQEVLDLTAMSVKVARTLLGTIVLGGPHYLGQEDVGSILQNERRSHTPAPSCEPTESQPTSTGAPGSESGEIAGPEIPTLETERLRLRAFREEDLDAYAEICADPEVMRYVGEGKPLSREESWRRLAMILGHWRLRGYGMWAVDERETGTLLGRIGFYRPEGWPGFEIGWTLGRPAWGRGYATEGARAALNYGIETYRPSRVISLIHPENVRSVRVAEKIGESHLGTAELYGIEALLYGIDVE